MCGNDMHYGGSRFGVDVDEWDWDAYVDTVISTSKQSGSYG